MAGRDYFRELPEGIEEMLPARAAHFEKLRRDVLDLFHSWGYALVIPPLLEYADAPSAGAGSDLRDLRFQFTDPLSGRSLALRPDITPQTARIDAQSLRHDGSPVRLCYAGDVLHTKPRRPLARRQPFPAGVELYGSRDLAADLEIITLMLETLRRVLPKPTPLCLDLGHMGIYQALAADTGLQENKTADLFDALQRKAVDEIEKELHGWQVSDRATRLRALLDLHGGPQVLEEARRQLAGAPAEVMEALDTLEAVVRHFAPEVDVYLDFGELRGYRYHTGIVFAVYAPGQGEPVANGGRYDGIGEAFGRARPAVGFSTDLVTLADIQGVGAYSPGGIFAPAEEEGQGQREAEIAKLRVAGLRVVAGLPGQSKDPSCDRLLVWRDNQWRVEPAAS